MSAYRLGLNIATQIAGVTTGGTGAWLDTFSCYCIGPQNGQPRCPCAMRNIIQRDGRWIEPEKDLGPVSPTPTNPNSRSEG